jgi:arsenate reductase-like glutaredoxin family protein
MAARRVKYYTYGDDERCHDIRKFIQEAEVMLDVRDMEKNPLSYDELSALFGHCNINHFINRGAKSFEKHGLDKKMPSREEVLKLMAEDYQLIRRPIIKTARLFTVGYSKKAITHLLQVNSEQQVQRSEPRRDRSSSQSRGKSSRRGSGRQEAYSASGK